MKRIRRLPDSPAGLEDYLEVETRKASWDGFRSHDGGRAHRGLIRALTDRQHGVCGYCEILPPSKTFTGIALEGAVEASGSDFEALYNLYRLACDDRIDEPDQLRLWREES